MKKFIPILMVLILLFGCITPEPVENTTNTTGTENPSAELVVEPGDTVIVDYVGMYENGTIFDTSVEEIASELGFNAGHSYQPLQFVAGEQQVIVGFDNAVIGMKVGEEKTVTISPEQGYGEVDETLIMEFPLESVPENLSVGEVLATDQGYHGTVTALTNETATVDFNHPLAGETLVFKIVVLDIQQ